MEARHWSIAIPAFRATTDVDPRASPPDIARRPRRPHRPSPCTSSPRRCHKTSAFPAAAPKDRTDSAPHANRAARRTRCGAYEPPLPAGRDPFAQVFIQFLRALHIQAPHDQNCHSRPRRAHSGRRQCKIECSTEGVGTTRIARHPQRPRIRRIERTAPIGAAYSRRLARSRRMPSFRAAARRSDRNTLAPTDRSVSESRPEASTAETESAHAIAAAEERQKG